MHRVHPCRNMGGSNFVCQEAAHPDVDCAETQELWDGQSLPVVVGIAELNHHYGK